MDLDQASVEALEAMVQMLGKQIQLIESLDPIVHATAGKEALVTHSEGKTVIIKNLFAAIEQMVTELLKAESDISSIEKELP